MEDGRGGLGRRKGSERRQDQQRKEKRVKVHFTVWSKDAWGEQSFQSFLKIPVLIFIYIFH